MFDFDIRSHYSKDCIDGKVISSAILQPSRPEQHIRYQSGYVCSSDHHGRIRSQNHGIQHRAMANTHIGYRKPLQLSGTYPQGIGIQQNDLQAPVSTASLDLAVVCKNLRKLDMNFRVDKVSI
jgi:hypothetical protein